MKTFFKLSLGLIATFALMLFLTASPIFAAMLTIGSFALAFAAPMNAFMILINPANLTWNGDEVKALAETILIDIYENPAIEDTMTVHNNIVAKTQIAYLGLLSKITKADAGCSGSAMSKNIPMTQKYWNPVDLKSWLSICYKDLEASFWIWGQANKFDRADLIGDKSKVTQFIMERMSNAGLEDSIRIAWFGDTNIKDGSGSPGNLLTPGTDITDYNVLDGLWKQIYADDILYSTQHVAIANNSNATYATQAFGTTDVTNKTVTNLFYNMIAAADPRLSDSKGQMLLVTRSIYQQYLRELGSYTAVEASFELVQDGETGITKKVLQFNGYPVIKMTLWDRYIAADYNDGTVTYQPHRAILCTKESFALGVDAQAGINEFELYYYQNAQTVNFRGMYRMDTKIVKDYMYVSAY